MGKDILIKWAQEADSILILISDKIDKQIDKILSDRKFYYKDFAILNIHSLYTRATKFIKETPLQLKSHIAPHTLIVDNFNTTFSPIGHPDKN